MRWLSISYCCFPMLLLLISSCGMDDREIADCFDLQDAALAAPKKPVADRGICASAGYLVRDQTGLLYLVETEGAVPDVYAVSIADSAYDQWSFDKDIRQVVSGEYKIISEISLSLMKVHTVERVDDR